MCIVYIYICSPYRTIDLNIICVLVVCAIIIFLSLRCARSDAILCLPRSVLLVLACFVFSSWYDCKISFMFYSVNYAHNTQTIRKVKLVRWKVYRTEKKIKSKQKFCGAKKNQHQQLTLKRTSSKQKNFCLGLWVNVFVYVSIALYFVYRAATWIYCQKNDVCLYFC